MLRMIQDVVAERAPEPVQSELACAEPAHGHGERHDAERLTRTRTGEHVWVLAARRELPPRPSSTTAGDRGDRWRRSRREAFGGCWPIAVEQQIAVVLSHMDDQGLERGEGVIECASALIRSPSSLWPQS